MSVLRFRRDRRQRDPFTAAPVTWPDARFENPHGIATDETLADIASQAQAAAQAWQAADPVAETYPGLGTTPAPVSIAADYRELRVFPAVVRGACRIGLTGLGTRGLLVPPLPDWDLDACTADADATDDLGPEWDQVAEHYEAGFFNARRVFHSADTAGFPAVSA